VLIIIGNTGTGKSTLAQKIAECLPEEEPVVISAGRWIREYMDEWGHGPEVAAKLSKASTDILRKDPTYCLRWLRSQTETCRPVIVEGMRNPVDFTGLFTPGQDIVIQTIGGKPANEFERTGLEAINAYLAFLQRMSLVPMVSVDAFGEAVPETCAQLLLERW